MLIFLIGVLLGVLLGGALCVRYLRREVAGDIGPQLKRIRLQLDSLEAVLNLALLTRYTDLSTPSSTDRTPRLPTSVRTVPGRPLHRLAPGQDPRTRAALAPPPIRSLPRMSLAEAGGLAVATLLRYQLVRSAPQACQQARGPDSPVRATARTNAAMPKKKPAPNNGHAGTSRPPIPQGHRPGTGLWKLAAGTGWFGTQCVAGYLHPAIGEALAITYLSVLLLTALTVALSPSSCVAATKRANESSASCAGSLTGQNPQARKHERGMATIGRRRAPPGIIARASFEETYSECQ